MPTAAWDPAANASLSHWTQLLIETLVEAGIRRAIISPGSRSTPIVLAALASKELHCYCIVDERSAAFFALGQARVSARPSVLICTSGTAAANYYPAVIEAKLSGLPLLILSADRPSELQYCGAPQTVDQLKLFGTFAQFVQLGEASGDSDARRALRRTVLAGATRAMEGCHGPVHFNFQVRKPLEFLPRLGETQSQQSTVPRQLIPRLGTCIRQPVPSLVHELAQQIARARHPLVVAGALAANGTALREALRAYLDASDSLICAETVSQLRWGIFPESREKHLDAFDWLFSHAAPEGSLKPDLILQLGSAPLSRGLQLLLERSRQDVPLVICSTAGETDAFHRSAQIVDCEPAILLEMLTKQLLQLPPLQRNWQPWLRSNRIAWQCVDQALSQDFTEATAVRGLISQLPPRSCLMVGNSLAPRHLDRYGKASDRAIVVGSQRGASGIEGAVASALGAATVFSGAVTLLVGDVSFLHDLGGLWAGAHERLLCGQFPYPVVLVVLNNGGGRIFEQLPLAHCGSVALQWWTTPHEVHMGELASGFSVPHCAVHNPSELTAALKLAYRAKGLQMIEVKVPPSGAQHTAQTVETLLDERLGKAEKFRSERVGATR